MKYFVPLRCIRVEKQKNKILNWFQDDSILVNNLSENTGIDCVPSAHMSADSVCNYQEHLAAISCSIKSLV